MSEATAKSCVWIADTLQCIAEMLQITKQAMGLDVPITEKKLERSVSRVKLALCTHEPRTSQGGSLMPAEALAFEM